MKSVIILAATVMMILTGCGSSSDGSFSTNAVDTADSNNVVVSSSSDVSDDGVQAYVSGLSFSSTLGTPPGHP